jgi:hypothetical protein
MQLYLFGTSFSDSIFFNSEIFNIEAHRTTLKLIV